jgi:hypothetical protein
MSPTRKVSGIFRLLLGSCCWTGLALRGSPTSSRKIWTAHQDFSYSDSWASSISEGPEGTLLLKSHAYLCLLPFVSETWPPKGCLLMERKSGGQVCLGHNRKQNFPKLQPGRHGQSHSWDQTSFSFAQAESHSSHGCFHQL